MLGLACLAAVNVSAVAEAGANPFACVPFESGLYEDVAALVHDGLIYGYTDSTFDAKHPLSRYEMAIFTGKALTSYQSAGPEDRARITKLATQFRDELAGMGASLPGTQKSRSSRKKTGGESGGSKGRIGNVEITGHIEHLWNAERKTYTNETKASSRYKNSTEDKYFDLEVQLNAKANLGGGWTGNVGFTGRRTAAASCGPMKTSTVILTSRAPTLWGQSIRGPRWRSVAIRARHSRASLWASIGTARAGRSGSIKSYAELHLCQTGL